ncbi:MAG: prolyl oligopeptidase family serine peptidase, partial [Planctomycetes bacterium]|nr:prolyl oligopeptidase family serine peptidase [Planctomycetota bacterium]
MRIYVAVMMCILLPALALAQDKKPGDAMIEKYLAAEADKLSAKFLDGAKTIDEWKAKRPRLYQEYMDMLGLWPIPEKTDLKATRTGEVEAHGIIVEKLHFLSKPGLYVTANLYRPKGDASAKRKQLPAIVYVCGHSGKGRDGNKTAFQDHGFWFANNGYVCIILDTLQLGEIPGVHHGTYGRPWGHLKAWGVDDAEKMKNHNRFWWHSIGYSPAAVECWNGIRAIDYLCTLPYVDPDKIGVTGISGGGAATFWIAAADERVKVAVPVSGMADLDYYVRQKGVNSHCDCMFLYNTYQWDWTTIAALVAPRPLLFANSDNDPIFPMDANRRIYKKLQTIYGLHGMEKLVREHVSVGGHDYRPDLRKAIFHFFNMYLKQQPTPFVEDSAKYTPLEGRKLRVFPTDDDLPKDAINHRIDELFIPAAKVTLPEKGKFDEWKKGMIAKLRFTFPKEILTTSEFYVVKSGRIKDGPGDIAVFYSEPEYYAKNKSVDDLVRKYSPTANYRIVFFPRFYSIPIPGEPGGYPAEVVHSWTAKSPPNFVERSHVLLGRTIDELKVYRLMISVARFRKQTEIGGDPDRIVAVGQPGIIAAYAALMEPKLFKEITIIDPPKSHKEGPHF